MDVSLDRQIACVNREIGLRQKVYPKFVATGRMTQQKADEEIMLMRAVLGTLMQAKMAAQPDLF